MSKPVWKEYVPVVISNENGRMIQVNSDMTAWVADGVTWRDAIALLSRAVCTNSLPFEVCQALSDKITGMARDDAHVAVEALQAEVERLRGARDRLRADLAVAREALEAARLPLAEHEPHPLPALGKVLAAIASITQETIDGQ